MFAIETVVRMSQVDPAGTIYFARVPELAYSAYEAFLDHMGWSLGENLAGLECLTPVVQCTTEYKKPIRLSDRLQITVDAERIGKTSFTLLFTLVGLESQVRAVVRVVQVTVNRKTFEPMPLPTMVREGLEKLHALPAE